MGPPGPNFFSHFSIKKFFASKNFSYICDTNKRIRQWKKIAWNEPAQPAIRDDYFSSLIGPEMDTDKAVELVDRMQKRVDSLDEETVSYVSLVLSEMVKLANELSGMDNTLTKREALLVCMGFKTGEAYVCGKYGINE